jgi:hypothetical protein
MVSERRGLVFIEPVRFTLEAIELKWETSV